ncbi:aldehyde dehydrogenase family protein [Nonomuraea rubra]|uniref:aldehyde dehydrogenase family protein n=1 Tax=Nonomuraea rubra TaxID=46180 RepID=UPI00361E8DC8
MIRKAVIPVAGLGTRLLPLTKALPKEMLPIGDKPVIEHTIRELVDSGIDEITIVTSARKELVQRHFAPDGDLERELRAAGKDDLAGAVAELSSLAHITYLYQRGPYGNGTPVLNAARVIGDEPFMVLWADDVFVAEVPRARQLKSAYEATGAPVLALMPMEVEDAAKYGVPIVEEDLGGGRLRISGLVEKPRPEEAPRATPPSAVTSSPPGWSPSWRRPRAAGTSVPRARSTSPTPCTATPRPTRCTARSSTAPGGTPARRSTTCGHSSPPRWPIRSTGRSCANWRGRASVYERTYEEGTGEPTNRFHRGRQGRGGREHVRVDQSRPHGRGRGAGRPGGRGDVRRGLPHRQEAQREWAKVPAPVRGRVIASIGRLVEANTERLARLVTEEIGKPYAEALGEVREIVDTCDFFLGEGRRLYGQTVPSEMPDKNLFTFRNPIGVAAVVTAGNFPVAVPSWYLVPALLCGNAVVWKPAEYAAASAHALFTLFTAAGLPDGVLNIVFADGAATFGAWSGPWTRAPCRRWASPAPARWAGRSAS